MKTNILTVDGKDLGNVTDIFFDSSSGMVDSMEVSQGGLKHISEGKKSIRPSDIVTIGANATIVSNYTESKFEAQGEEGGLKGAINDVKAKSSGIVDDTQQALSEVADTTKKRTAAFAESAREKSLELRDDAQETYDDMKDASKRRGNDVRHQTT